MAERRKVHDGLIVWVPVDIRGIGDVYQPCLVEDGDEALKIIASAGGSKLKDIIITREQEWSLEVY